jgi:hypothetical protein
MTRRSLLSFLASGLLAGILAACAAQASSAPTRLSLETLNGSGVTGSVTLTAIEEARTMVVVEVDPAGHPDMPAHIHPGTCAELVPQPRYPLANVVDGRSTTEVNASLDELLAGDVALNLHASNQEMQLYTACVELR